MFVRTWCDVLYWVFHTEPKLVRRHCCASALQRVRCKLRPSKPYHLVSARRGLWVQTVQTRGLNLPAKGSCFEKVIYGTVAVHNSAARQVKLLA